MAGRAAKQFSLTDLRWSYLVNGTLLVIGLLCIFLMKNGWTVCPFLGAAGIIVMLNEASDRNGQGVPPLRVYLFFFGAVMAWVLAVTVLSVVNVWILLIGVVGSLWYTAKCIIKVREHEQLMALRIEQKLCIHCGAPIVPDVAFCQECGQEPNPDETRLKRIRGVMSNRKSDGRMRAALTETPQAVAARKERALLQRRRPNR